MVRICYLLKINNKKVRIRITERALKVYYIITGSLRYKHFIFKKIDFINRIGNNPVFIRYKKNGNYFQIYII